MVSVSRSAPASRRAADSRRAATPRLTLIALLVILLVGAMLVGAALVLPGCSGESESIVGIWWSVEQGETLDFRSDGTLLFTNAVGEVDALQWQADTKNVAIGVEGGGTRTLGYSIRDGVLTLTHPDEQPARYERARE